MGSLLRKAMTAAGLVASGDWREAKWRLRRNLGLVSDREIVARRWDFEDKTAVRSFWQLPQIPARWNAMITGDPDKTYYEYVMKKYFADPFVERALSLCCGTGDWEREWARYCTFGSLEGIDLSPRRLEIARAKAAAAGFVNWHYQVADVNELELAAETYDVVLANASLHHIVNLEHLFTEIRKALRPHGVFIINDFVGPTRFQWTDRQLQVVNAMLEILPPEYKHLISNPGSLKQKVTRPHLKGMIQHDPSEAIRSQEIPALLRQYFQIVEWKELGGALLHLLLHDIAGNFVENREGGTDLLELCFQVEDTLMAIGDLQSDYIFAVCRR